MTCFLLRDGRRHKINAFLLLCGHIFSKFCGCGRECNTHVAGAGGSETLRVRAVIVRNSAGAGGSRKKKTVQRRALHCGTRKSNDSGNTSSMATYLKQHHPGVSLTGVKTKAAQQPHITAAIMQPLVAQSDRLKPSQTMGVFIGADMRPNSFKGRKYAFLCCTLSCFSLIMLKRRYYALCTLR